MLGQTVSSPAFILLCLPIHKVSGGIRQLVEQVYRELLRFKAKNPCRPAFLWYHQRCADQRGFVTRKVAVNGRFAGLACEGKSGHQPGAGLLGSSHLIGMVEEERTERIK
jgi:hypothetical protein